jgi:hypothetical protein
MLGTKRRAEGAPRPAPIAYSKPTVEVRNSFCAMYSFPQEAMDLIRALLTYENEDIQFEINQCFRMLEHAKREQNEKKTWVFKKKLDELKAKRIVCWLKDDKFPTGHLDIVKNALADLGSDFDLVDHRRVPRVESHPALALPAARAALLPARDDRPREATRPRRP